MRKSILSVLLCIVMVLSLMPTAVFAAEGDSGVKLYVRNPKSAQNEHEVVAGKTFTVQAVATGLGSGVYLNDSNIEWTLSEHHDGTTLSLNDPAQVTRDLHVDENETAEIITITATLKSDPTVFGTYYVNVRPQPKYVSEINLTYNTSLINTGSTYAEAAQAVADNYAVSGDGAIKGYYSSSNCSMYQLNDSSKWPITSDAALSANCTDVRESIDTISTDKDLIFVFQIQAAPDTQNVRPLAPEYDFDEDNLSGITVKINGVEQSVVVRRYNDAWRSVKLYVLIPKDEIADTFKSVAVTGVSLNKSSTSITFGKNERLTATVLPEIATNKSVTWTSDNTSVATVDASGYVTAVAAGTATITVTTADGSKTATCEVTVTPVAVTGVTLNETSASIVVGATEQLTATVAPENAPNKNVTWTSSNTSVATVDADGVVTAVAAGTATITVTTEDGGKTATCEVTVPCSHGNTEVRDAIAATCNEAGYTGDTYCKDCGEKLASGTSSDAKGHTYGDWVTTKEATETKTGTKERTCSACGDKDTDVIPVLTHTHNGTLKSGTSATCTAAGVKDYYTCSCGKAFEDATCNIEIVDLDAWKAEGGNGYIAPKGHTYGEWAITKEPTETETGSKERTCSACGNKDTGIIPVLEHIHNVALQNGTAATCTTAGFKDYYTCSCGLVFEDATCNIEVTDLTAWKAVGGNGYIVPTGHSFTTYTSNNDATCTADGTKTATCANGCGATDTVADTGSAKGHNFTNYVSDGNATCTADGTKTAKCDNCDVTDTQPDAGSAKGHTYGEWVTTKEPTLTEKGMKERICFVCDAKETEEIPVLTPVTYSIISGANSEWTKGSTDGLVLASDADFAKFVCVKVNGAEIAATNYTAVSGSTKVTLNAAYLETLSEGSHSFEIVSNDGSASANFTVKAAESPAPTDPTNPTSPQTGDNSHMFLWIALLFVSSSALVGTAVYVKRRKRAE